MSDEGSTLGADHEEAESDRPRLEPVPDAGTDPRAVASEVLLARVAKGDQAAFASLYDRVSDQVYGLVRRILRDPARSEEVAQEVLLEVWRQAARYEPDKGSAKGWVMTMTHRRAVDRVRSEQSSRDRDEHISARDNDDAFDVVEEEVESRMEHQRVREAMAALTDLQREALELAYYGGLTYREVAMLLDAPLGTVKTRLRDGLIRLRDNLGVTH
jgi:RNA polymerase sigma-70 factor (ECF subfamily)